MNPSRFIKYLQKWTWKHCKSCLWEIISICDRRLQVKFCTFLHPKVRTKSGTRIFCLHFGSKLILCKFRPRTFCPDERYLQIIGDRIDVFEHYCIDEYNIRQKTNFSIRFDYVAIFRNISVMHWQNYRSCKYFIPLRSIYASQHSKMVLEFDKYCLQLWIRPVLFSNCRDSIPIRPVLNSPTI